MLEGNEYTQQIKQLEQLQTMGIDVDVDDEELRQLEDEIAAELPAGPVRIPQEQQISSYTEEKPRAKYVV